MKRLVLFLFFLSGACGLVYQVVWTRMMTHVFGTTALAVGTVLAAFMAGLAAGSWLLGKAADRSRNPLRLYAQLEIGVGVAAFAAHFLLGRITPVYLAAYEMFGGSDAMLSAVRFVLAFGLVMAPTLLMGATLPVLSRFVVTRLSTAGAGLSALYAINTVGAVAGTVVTGFYLIGAYGIHLTVYLAVLGNLAIGAVAWLVSGRATAPAVIDSGPRPKPTIPSGAGQAPWSGAHGLLLVGIAISGLTSFAYEIYWTRSLVFLLGNSTYAVTTMLAAFLTGIALGGYLVRFVVDRVADRMALFGWVQVLIGICSAAALPVLFFFADPQRLHVLMGEVSHRGGSLLWSRFGIALAVMLVPATLIGATFPLVGRVAVLDLRRTGSAIGRIYALNTIGNVAGALLPGAVLLHWLGIQRGILAMAVLNACVGLTVLFTRPARFAAARWVAPVAFLVVAFVVARTTLGFQFPSEAQNRWHRVLFYQEGPSATTKVLFDPDTREKSMSVDGVDIGGTEFTDYKQQLLAHLPKLLADDVSVELSIGLGSAILVGESARHERVREITCVEIEPSVVAGAALFAEESHGVLQDPRLRVVVDDIANHLRTTSDVYQVISADEKTAQDYASNGFSYSREYYLLLRQRLAPGGMVVQWVPTDLPPSQYAMVLETFSGSFPHTQVWAFLPALKNGPSNTILVGSNDGLRPDYARMRRLLASDPESFAGLARYGLTTAEAVLAHFVADGDTLRRALGDVPENTLDHPRYEFFSPRDYAVPTKQRLAVNYDFLIDLRREALPAFRSELASETEDTARLDQALAAETAYLEGYREQLSGAPPAEVSRRYEEALALAPWNDSLRSRLFLHYWNTASKSYVRQDPRAAANLLRRGLALDGKNPHARTEYGILLMEIGAVPLAVEQARIAVDLAPEFILARRVLADALLRTGRTGEAAEQWRAILEIEPEDAGARAALARLQSLQSKK